MTAKPTSDHHCPWCSTPTPENTWYGLEALLKKDVDDALRSTIERALKASKTQGYMASDEDLGVDAIAEWMSCRPEDLVAATRHLQECGSSPWEGGP